MRLSEKIDSIKDSSLVLPVFQTENYRKALDAADLTLHHRRKQVIGNDGLTGRWPRLSIEVSCYSNCRHKKRTRLLGAGIARTIAPNSGNDLSSWKGIHCESH
jgi:hypothetical protein